MELGKIFHEEYQARLLKFLFLLCTIVFFTLCLLHYFSQRPLWSDEEWVFKSIEQLKFPEIFGMLIGAQVFPRVYLFCIKFLSEHFHGHVLALRFLPLVFMTAAYFVWLKICLIEFKKSWPAFLAVLTFVCANQLSYYSAELKPYSMDVLAVGIYGLFIYAQGEFREKNPPAKLYAYAALSPLLIFFSYGALFAFWLPVVNFLLLLKRNKKYWPVFIVNAVASLGCFAVLYQIDLQYSVIQKGLYDYWHDYFLGTDSFYAFIAPFGEGLREQATWWFGRSKFFVRAATPFVPLFVYALVRFGFGQWKKDKGAVLTGLSMGAFLFIELILMSLLKKYPFTGERITLFLAPFVFLLIVKALNSLTKIRPVYYVLVVYYVIFMITALCASFIFYSTLYTSHHNIPVSSG